MMNIPTIIFVGNEQATLTKAEQILCDALCPHKQENCYCNICRSIQQHQTAAARFINPEKDYTVDDIDQIIKESRLARDPGESFFFVLCKAETLSVAPANRLLKLLEEPPYGYHFILLTNNLDALLPTIVSRARVELIHTAASPENTPLLAYFYHDSKLANPALFEQALNSTDLTDSKSIELVNVLFEHYQQHHHSLIVTDGADEELVYTTTVIDYLQKIMEQPPQSGSSTIFWKMLFMTFPKRK